MNISKDSQGYVGDINTKSISELRELLESKERLLANRSLLQSLPDKGEKIREFVQKYKLLIETKSCTSGSRISSLPPRKAQKDSLELNTSNSAVVSQNTPTKQIATDEPQKKDEPDANIRRSSIQTRPPDSTENIAADLQNMTIDPSGHLLQSGEVSGNAYEKILKRDSELLTWESPKFMPNKSLRSKDGESARTERPHHKMESRPAEESAVRPPQYKHQSTKLISLSESIQLTIEQQRKNEELAIERATRRLLGQASTKMGTYSPPSVDMNYRQHSNNQQELDSDDDDDDDDDGNS